MAKVPEDKFECPNCKGIFSLDEENDDGEENEDYNGTVCCSVCDGDEEQPYCGGCALYFEDDDFAVCPTCLNKELQRTPNLKGHVIEKIVEKIVEKPVYITANGQTTNTTSEETMEDFERRIVGMP